MDNALYKCELCEFVDPDEGIVIRHIDEHRTLEEQEKRSFFSNARAITICEQSCPTEHVEEREPDPDNHVSWSDQSTKLLLSQYSQKKPLVECGKIKTLKRMWANIAEEMAAYGFTFTPQQTENKWKSLERGYKNKILNGKKTGRGRTFCPYERELRDILATRHSINPQCILGSVNTEEIADQFGSSSNSDRSHTTTPDIPNTATQSTSTSHETTPNTPKTPTAATRSVTVARELSELRKIMLGRNKKREEMEEKKILQREQIIEQLKLKNELLQKLLNKDS